jgi:predicted dienelactone hydrolase
VPTAENGAAQAQLDRFARARDNYIALRDGRISVSDLSAEELQNVLDLDRRTRGDYPDPRTTRERCVDEEVRRAGGRPSQLARQVIAMKCRD